MTNGRVKRWGYAEDVDEFLIDPKQFARVNELWSDVRNSEEFDENLDETIDVKEAGVVYLPDTKQAANRLDPKNYSKVVKDPPRFWQHSGKLTIFNADVRSQGVYFCYDDESKKQTSFFYVLMAMIPPVLKKSDNPTTYTDNCGANNGKDATKLAPSHNWRWHFLPMGDLAPPPSCNFDAHDCTYPHLDKRNWPSNFDEQCSMEWCRAKIHSSNNKLDLYIELRWDHWTSCQGDQPTKRREAHCYLLRGDGSINTNQLRNKENYKWVHNLHTILDRHPFDQHGIRLYSSLLVAAIMDKPKLTSCYSEDDDDNNLYSKYDHVWRTVLLPTLIHGYNNHTEIDQLRNPFEACLRYSKDPDSEYVLGTYSTQVDYC